MKRLIAITGTLLLSLPLLGQTNFGSGITPTSPVSTPTTTTTPSTAPVLDPGNTAVAPPTINRDANTTINNTGVEPAGTGINNGTGTGFGTGTGAGTGTGFSPVAPTSPGNTPPATNPMGGWQGR